MCNKHNGQKQQRLQRNSSTTSVRPGLVRSHVHIADSCIHPCQEESPSFYKECKKTWPVGVWSTLEEPRPGGAYRCRMLLQVLVFKHTPFCAVKAALQLVRLISISASIVSLWTHIFDSWKVLYIWECWNFCFSGFVPSSFKQATVQPLIKKKEQKEQKHNLDPLVLSNHRPVAKLAFLVLVNVAYTQLESHLDFNDFGEKFHPVLNLVTARKLLTW